MPGAITPVDGGTITSVRGFKAGGTYAGIKTYSDDKMDVGMLLSDTPCAAAGVFTRSSIVSPSVTVNRETLAGGQAIRGLVVNSGIANAGVGEQGYIDAKQMAVLASAEMGVKAEEVLVFSTGIIGVELPMTLIRSGVEQTELSESGGNPLARAMMTTDTHPKEVAVSVDIGGTEVRIGGLAKGSGMIHPNMATMLCFVATDAAHRPGASAIYAAAGSGLLAEHAHRGWRQQYQRLADSAGQWRCRQRDDHRRDTGGRGIQGRSARNLRATDPEAGPGR